MCGIAGFSLSDKSRINARQLSNALLTAIEDRGYMASGYGFHYNGIHGYHSAAKPGSSLSLKHMPRKSKTVILHTRLATHGSVDDNRNNHPVTSPDLNIALVHNGVIYNHQQVRQTISAKLPPVDTSVIPALLEQHGLQSIDQLDGDAAIAWLDKRDPDMLHLARYQHSPLTMAQLEDGSFVFASTEALLWRALIQLDLAPTWMYTANDLEYFTIRFGVMLSKEMLPAPKDTGSRWDYNYYRHQTSGAKGSGYRDNIPSYVPGFGWDDDWSEEDIAEYNAWNDSFDQPQYRPTLNNVFWTQVKEELMSHPDTLFYTEDERELWLNELYMMADDPSLEVIDYGQVLPDGELVSAMNDESQLF